jgi:hypothetical protein
MAVLHSTRIENTDGNNIYLRTLGDKMFTDSLSAQSVFVGRAVAIVAGMIALTYIVGIL